jgi:hypothetical protein
MARMAAARASQLPGCVYLGCGAGGFDHVPVAVPDDPGEGLPGRPRRPVQRGERAQDRRYQQRPQRFEYLPTGKAVDFVPALLALVAWGDRWTAPGGPPVLFTHRTCGHDTTATVVCSACSAPLTRAVIDFPPRTRQPAGGPAGTAAT